MLGTGQNLFSLKKVNVLSYEITEKFPSYHFLTKKGICPIAFCTGPP